MFIVALFTIAKTWKQTKCPSKEDVVYIFHFIYLYINTHTHTHNGILLSHKRNEIMPFVATWMNLEVIILIEISQTEKDK